MVFKVTATGVNTNYGIDGEIFILGDSQLIRCLQKGYIKNTVEYLGNGRKLPLTQMRKGMKT